MRMESFGSNEERVPGIEVGEVGEVTPEELAALEQLSGKGAPEDDGTALEDATEIMEGRPRRRKPGNGFEIKKAA